MSCSLTLLAVMTNSSLIDCPLLWARMVFTVTFTPSVRAGCRMHSPTSDSGIRAAAMSALSEE